ncbi:hypothetical protein ADUPG1_007232 [Aduncisulcus paluster]|uniref:Reverse transcriptase n=1 Tax=Aduncisulcus paluster TaxID=2918883 RepID=A0ABQ5KL88_9EUKA|nr:hypothetical protein ADUPG1_007232 [Aduncisulcus paluster]
MPPRTRRNVTIENNIEQEESERSEEEAPDTTEEAAEAEEGEKEDRGDEEDEFEHYRGLGGKKSWTELLSSQALGLVRTVSKVTDFGSENKRQKAYNAVNKLFSNSTSIGLYDELRLCIMQKKLSLEALLHYISNFRAIRERSPKVGTEPDMARIFIKNLCSQRLRDRINAVINVEEVGLDEAYRTAIEQVKKIAETEREHAAIALERIPTHGEKEEEKACYKCGELGHIARYCPKNKGKRRTHTGEFKKDHEKRSARVPFIRHRDPRYKRFFPGVICPKCKKVGHYGSACQEKVTAKEASKSNNEYLKSFTTDNFENFTRNVSLFIEEEGEKIETIALLDTGASSSVISMNLVKRLGIPITHEHHKTAETANGDKIQTCGEAELNIEIPGPRGLILIIKETFHVIEMEKDTSHEVLIGASTIIEHDLLGWQSYDTEESKMVKEIEELEIDVPEKIAGPIKIKCELPEVKTQIRKIIDDYESIIDRNQPAKVEKYEIIVTEGAKPVKLKQRPVPIHLLEKVSEKLNDFVRRGFIVHTKSPYSAPMTFAPKPGGDIRICIDYRLLNKSIEDDAFTVPSQKELFRALEGKRFFAAIDLQSGYYNVDIEEKSRPLTAFSTPLGGFQWNRMPFGLKTAPGHFQRVMTNLLFDMIGHACLIYLDDILIFGRTKESFLKNLSDVVHRLGFGLVELERLDELHEGILGAIENAGSPSEAVERGLIHNSSCRGRQFAWQTASEERRLSSLHDRSHQRTQKDLLTILQKLHSKDSRRRHGTQQGRGDSVESNQERTSLGKLSQAQHQGVRSVERTTRKVSALYTETHYLRKLKSRYYHIHEGKTGRGGSGEYVEEMERVGRAWGKPSHRRVAQKRGEVRCIIESKGFVKGHRRHSRTESSNRWDEDSRCTGGSRRGDYCSTILPGPEEGNRRKKRGTRPESTQQETTETSFQVNSTGGSPVCGGESTIHDEVGPEKGLLANTRSAQETESYVMDTGPYCREKGRSGT